MVSEVTEAPPEPTAADVVEAIVEATAELLNIPEATIRGRSRKGPTVRARFVVYWLGWFAGISYSELGRILDRDHATVLSGVRRMNADLRIDVDLVDLIREIAVKAGITA